MKKSYLAIDMGASSGRHVVGHFDGKKIGDIYIDDVVIKQK